MEFSTKKRQGPRQMHRLPGPRALWLVGVVCTAFACSYPPVQPAGPSGESATAPTAPPSSAAPNAAPTPTPTKQAPPVAAQMHNILFRFSETAAAHIESLTGEILPTGSNIMPVLDDKSTFVLRIRSARISVSPQALASIMNSYVFAKSDAPLKDLSF